MNDLSKKINEYNQKKREQYRAVMAGGQPPACYQFAQRGKPELCGEVCTHVSKQINPAGYHDWACSKHAIDEKESDMWGSDPGWPTTFENIESAREKLRRALL